jgi:hypothetical protein
MAMATSAASNPRTLPRGASFPRARFVVGDFRAPVADFWVRGLLDLDFDLVAAMGRYGAP